MTEYAELEINFERQGTDRFAVAFRFSLPDSDVERRGKVEGHHIAVDELRQLVTDPAAYGRRLGHDLFQVAGVREALARRNVKSDPNWVHIGDLEEKKFVRSLTGPLLPDAYVCANDHTAAQLLRELHQAKVRVPEDVRVVGFDDVKFATLVSPPLTTMQQPCREIALTAFRAMMDRLSDATLPACHLSLSPRLVIRDSCGAYLPSRTPT